MSRKSRHKPHNQRNISLLQQPEHLKTDAARSNHPILQSGLDFLAIVLGIIGILLWLPSFAPHVQVHSWGAVVPLTDLFSVPFTVTNAGLLPLHRVGYSCLLFNVRRKDNRLINKIALSKFEYFTYNLRNTDSFDFVCPIDNLRGLNVSGFISADIDIIITFQIPLLQRKFARCVEFIEKVSQLTETATWMQRPEENNSKCDYHNYAEFDFAPNANN
jgi:hypothetical protein